MTVIGEEYTRQFCSDCKDYRVFCDKKCMNCERKKRLEKERKKTKWERNYEQI